VPFSWNDNFSEEALEDFQQIQKDLPYLTCQSIGMALAKLEMLENKAVKCDRCGAVFEIASENGEANYCPNCGAKMVEPQESEG
jgi:predicted RNA-binding Zn-ribbon protein involved in translation (DUF1610 family)